MLPFTLSRRLVLGGLAAFVGAHEVVRTRVELPTLWGDMLHDDAPALNALFSGNPVRIVRGRAVAGAAPALLDARCLVASTVHVTVDDALLARVELKAAPDFRGDNLIRFTGHRALLTDSHLSMGASVAAIGVSA